jgi:hypothetical protein
MANTRTRLLKLLLNAEQVLAEAETLAAEFPIGSEDERNALSLLPELRDTVRRVQNMLSNPDDATAT